MRKAYAVRSLPSRTARNPWKLSVGRLFCTGALAGPVKGWEGTGEQGFAEEESL